MREEKKIVLSARNLCVRIQKDRASGRRDTDALVEYGTFDIYAGDFVLVKGRNGSGKSTLFRLLCLNDADYFSLTGDGQLLYRGEGFPDKSIDEYSDAEIARLRRSVVYIGQDDRFESWASGYAAMFNPAARAVDNDRALTSAQKKEKRRQIDGAVRAIFRDYIAENFVCSDFKTFKRKSVHAWSGGQQKMLHVLAGVVKAKVCGVRLMVLDEPLNNLDGKNKYYLNKVFSELRGGDTAILLITHCQIFDGINRVLEIAELPDGIRRATLYERTDAPHGECLESYKGAV